MVVVGLEKYFAMLAKKLAILVLGVQKNLKLNYSNGNYNDNRNLNKNGLSPWP